MLLERLVPGWRATRYLLRTFATATAALSVLPLLLLLVFLIPIGGAGLLLLPGALEQLRRWAERTRSEACGYAGLEHVYREPAPLPGGPRQRLRHTLRDPGTWRSVRWLVLQALLGMLAGLVGLIALFGPPAAVLKTAVWWAVPVPLTFMGIEAHGWGTALVGGLVETLLFGSVFLYGAPTLANGYARLVAWTLAPSEVELRANRLNERVAELSHTRAEALQAHSAELRRIERDLHDGTQARLAALAMRIGIAERLVIDDPEQAARLLREASGSAEEAMSELRDVIRTTYPPILADRGLDGAISALSARCAIPARTRVTELGTLPAAVQAAAYFVIAEALTNAAKHSAATSVDVAVRRDGATLRVEVTDNGIGGADGSGGSGIDGIRRRVAALDGTTSVVSPAGGPTVIRTELPCES